MKTTARTLILLLLTVQLLCGGAAAISVEQVSVVMPEIDVYLYEDGTDLSGLSADDVSAALGGQPLRINALGKSEQGIYYVYMLDVSASIPPALFDAAKAAILSASGRLRAQDRMAVLTFGNEVRLILQGGESREAIETALDAIGPNDSRTCFYNAMRAMVTLASETADMRRIAVVISDGIDDTDSGITQEELEQDLQQAGVSVNAMCIDTTPDPAGFAHLVDMTGGELYFFDQTDAAAVFNGLLERLDDGWVLALEADSNRASGEPTPLAIDVNGDLLELTVVPERYAPDSEFPRVASAEYAEETHSITVCFSEAMADLTDAEAYAVTDADGAALEIAELTAPDAARCILRLAGETPETGEIHLQISGLHDSSMEQNAMYAYQDLLWLRTARYAPTDAAPQTAPTDGQALQKLFLIGGIAAGLALLASAAAFLAVRLKRGGFGGTRRKPAVKSVNQKPGAVFVFSKKE